MDIYNFFYYNIILFSCQGFFVFVYNDREQLRKWVNNLLQLYLAKVDVSNYI